MSWAAVSSTSAFRATGRGRPAMLAAAAALMSGPGCTPSSRNVCAAVGLRFWQDQENIARMSVASSSVASASSPASAGHHHEAARAAGQQWAYLFGVPGVVEDNEHPALG